MNRKSNRQYQKTEIALQKALIDLLKDNNIEKITVTEITEKADVHRGTFYLHYKDVYDLFESVENDFFTKTQELYISYVVRTDEVDLKALFNKMHKLFSDNIQATRIMLDKGSFDFNEVFIFLRTHEYRGPKNFDEWHSHYSVGEKDNYMYFFTSLVSAVNAVVYAWFENGFEKSSIEIASIVTIILKKFGFKKHFKD